MQLTKNDVMTATEAADLLRVHIKTLYRMARRGEIPGRRMAGSWRFLRSELTRYLTTDLRKKTVGLINWKDFLDFLAMGERTVEKKVTWYWVNTSIATGGIGVSDGVVVDSAPYFSYLRGRQFDKLLKDPRIKEIVVLRSKGERREHGKD